MNPSTLYFSKRWSFTRVVLMALVCSAALWLLHEHALFAAPPPPPPAPPSPSDIMTGADHLAYFEAVRASQPARQYGMDRLTGGWFSVIVLIFCILFALWEGGMDLRRMLTRAPALHVQNGALTPHSIFSAPASIAFSQVREITLDRADRIRPGFWDDVMGAYSWSTRLGFKAGARARHVLLIDYLTEDGDSHSLRISDAYVEGGVEQLSRFAAYLRAMQSAAQQGSGRASA